MTTKDKENKIAFGNVVMCIAAGAIMADGEISVKEQKALEKIVKHNAILKELDPMDLMRKFKRFMVMYIAEKEESSQAFITMEKSLFKKLPDCEDRIRAAKCAWLIIARDGVEGEEEEFIDRIFKLLDITKVDIGVQENVKKLN